MNYPYMVQCMKGKRRTKILLKCNQHKFRTPRKIQNGYFKIKSLYTPNKWNTGKNHSSTGVNNGYPYYYDMGS